MVLTGMKLPVPTPIKRYGIEVVRKMYSASLESIDCVETITREENIDCNFSRCGHLEVACKQAHFDGYEESAALIQREFNHELRIIPKKELRNEIGSDIYFGGMVDDASAGLNPARYVAGLAARHSVLVHASMTTRGWKESKPPPSTARANSACILQEATSLHAK